MFLDIEGLKVPLKIKREWRKTVRFSISNKSINLALPKFYTRNQILEECHKINIWAKEQLIKSPSLAERFRFRIYNNNDWFKIYGNTFQIILEPTSQRGLSGEIDNNIVRLLIPEDLNETDKHHSVSTLLSRLFAKHYKTEISNRVYHFNGHYFNEEIHSIRLKNNQSNWGSCSSNRIINLSSRLLFAPMDVIDYVIVHELSHLKEMNHSSKFWKIVEEVMPDYKKKDKWLTKNGHLLRF